MRAADKAKVMSNAIVKTADSVFDDKLQLKLALEKLESTIDKKLSNMEVGFNAKLNDIEQRLNHIEQRLNRLEVCILLEKKLLLLAYRAWN